MAHVKNISEDRLGWSADIWEPGEVKEVSDDQAARMCDQNPTKFQILSTASPAPPEVHRHRYLAADPEKCVDCGHAKGDRGNGGSSEAEPSEPATGDPAESATVDPNGDRGNEE